MEIIDSHAHIYPQKIAEKATHAIGDFYNVKMTTSIGTADTLLQKGKTAGISRYVVHSCATKSEQVHAINLFIKEEMDKHSEFIGFMTLHQDMSEEDAFKEVDWCVKNGFKGVKLHPDFQKFNIDDKNVFKLYRAVENKLPILFHTGDKRFDFSKSFRLNNVVKSFPKVNFIGAHFGGYNCWDELDVYDKTSDNLFFDTSSSLPYIPVEKAKSLIEKFGSEKFLFGTDFPMWDASDEINRFMKIPVSEREKEQILALNIKNLLRIK